MADSVLVNAEEYEQSVDAQFTASAVRWLPRYEETETDRDSERALEHRWGFGPEPWEESRG